MKIMDYIKINKIWLISNSIIFIILNCILYSSSTINKSFQDIMYMDILILLTVFISFIYGFIKEKNKYSNILKYSDELDNKIKDFHLNVFSNMLEKQKLEYLKKEESLKNNINDFEDYITKWVHDIKINIAVIYLLLENFEEEKSQKIISEMKQMEFSVNQVLYVTRANNYNLDIKSEQVSVKDEIKKAIKENAEFFINKNIEIILEVEEFSIISDRKWIYYILSQIINNSSKYTNENGQLYIFSKEDSKAYYLHIKDNGIGIPKEDINRIFNKGFTGGNGRTRTKSTGIGLYYAKKMCNNLNIDLKVESEEGEYTEFILGFYKLADYFNVTPMSQ
ncbi:sensor histidine kinase [Clostridium botulinum]|uniref:histidine kinase n=4 Tax=Clostridium botulinum TaxID=1491 RepID=A0A3F3A512_CLOB6|nr:sensor histidine kinase [Clostridium botulinum]AJD28672.1 histidine kinase-, DNA gyrase B-, and HSP90-like ATPase family protein [Clostridium botulinum CDC_297]ACQ53454.1 periplasmic sensor signal transduction histidine kinase [Clostridium botulinum Ba4 str. 657]APR00784.1 histidine kinase-, DNA gyrase B-, and HSP90-like ATPase family protein [Clostridium botulinum]AUN01896.1 histidine kinase [Clostridium botulinum]AXG92518.1 sensor histidine kinase [Clostridium botulinum]